MDKNKIFEKIDNIYSEHYGGAIYLSRERVSAIKNIIQEAVDFAPCLKPLNVKARTKDKQQEVIQAVRKQLPRLMELDKGCEFIDNLGYKQLIVSVDENDDRDIRLFTVCTEDESTEAFYLPLRKWYEIIGKEPTILNALECYNKRDVEDSTVKGFLSLSSCGLLQWQDDFIEGSIGVGLYETKIDLSKPYIKDLEEEVINFLHSVLC